MRTIHIRMMTAADLPLGMRLKEQAGWNQIEADWRRCLALQPDGCFVAERDGIAVGTTTTCIFGSIAWIAMVLVDAAERGRGIGCALLERALAFLDTQGVRSVRLDATPLGRPLYEKLGFAEEYVLTRFDGMPSIAESAADSSNKIAIRAAHPDDLEEILHLDQGITGTDRQALLRHLFAETAGDWRTARRGDQLVGFAAGRPGSRAYQIGPCLAGIDAGPLLLADTLRRQIGQRVFVDVPADNCASVAVMESAGLSSQRPLVRMCRGPTPHECREQLWASFGPEKG
jgi:GNAT superfamily N-acetyltransferase